MRWPLPTLLLTALISVGATALAVGGARSAATVGAANSAPAVGGTAPMRVVSLNLCTDQLAVLLLPRDRIAALSFLSRDPAFSVVAEQAASLPVTRGQAEEVMALRPDIVLAGQWTTRATVALLKARGIAVVELGLAEDFDAIRAQTRMIAAALGAGERAEALLAEMDRTLASVTTIPGPRPTALTFAPGGFTAGSGTLTDAVVVAAGYDNLAARHGLSGYGYLPLETVVSDPPDRLVGGGNGPTYPSLQDQMLRHPALAHQMPGEVRADVPGALWTCGGPFTADAVRRLADARPVASLGQQP